MLRGEELILGGERAIDLADIERPPLGAGRWIEVRWQIGEGHDGFALGERRDRLVRQQCKQAGRGQSSSHSLSTCDVFRHVSPPSR